MQTLQKPRVLSPLQLAHRSSFDVQSKGHPIQEEVKKCVGTYTIQAVVEEDTQTLTTMKQVPGLISFLCTLTKDNRVISQGRGSAVLSPTNRYLNRTVYSAFNSALADAFIRSTKVLDTFRTGVEDPSIGVALGEAYRAKEGDGFEPATEKQLGYLRQLLSINVEDESEREGIEQNLCEFSKQEASRMIESFRR